MLSVFVLSQPSTGSDYMKPLIGVTGARGKSERRYGLPIFLHNLAYVHAV